MSKTQNEILNDLISKEKSDWINDAEYRIQNRKWLEKSAHIALRILTHIRKAGISQKQLAEMLSVTPQFINKIVKGSENLTLKTISSIELALGISLIEAPPIQTLHSIDKEYECKVIPFDKSISLIKDYRIDFLNKEECNLKHHSDKEPKAS